MSDDDTCSMTSEDGGGAVCVLPAAHTSTEATRWGHWHRDEDGRDWPHGFTPKASA